jgi:hypothetical protein
VKPSFLVMPACGGGMGLIEMALALVIRHQGSQRGRLGRGGSSA